jgi:hypothetical protein
MEPTDIAAGQVIATVSVTLWALEMGLYAFVFRYFHEKEELEKFRRGLTYWRFFGFILFSSFFALSAIFTAVLGLAIANVKILEVSFAFFIVHLGYGVIIVAREIRTSQKYVEPYSLPEVVGYYSKKAYRKALKKIKKETKEDLKKISDRQSAEKFAEKMKEMMVKALIKKREEKALEPKKDDEAGKQE